MKYIDETLPGTVSVLIGPNGSGKSRKLRELCNQALRRGTRVIAVSPTVHDRFVGIRNPNFQFFGARQGRHASKTVIRDALIRAGGDQPQILKTLTHVLKYTNFDPVVGVAIRWIDLDRFVKTQADLGLEPREFEELKYSIRAWHDGGEGWSGNIFPRGQYGIWKQEVVTKFSMEGFSFRELHALNFLSVLSRESLLVRKKIIAPPRYFFFRNGCPIQLLEACSGEIAFVTAMAFIATRIQKESCVMVDEPENSLHPTWQKNYISTFLDLFYQYQPRVVLATHSPIIVSGGEVTDQNTRVFDMSDAKSEEFLDANLNLEEMYERLFDIVTPKNYYLSRRSVDLLNQLNAGKIKVSDVIREFDSLAAKSYDEKQVRVIAGLKEIAKRMDGQEAKT